VNRNFVKNARCLPCQLLHYDSAIAHDLGHHKLFLIGKKVGIDTKN